MQLDKIEISIGSFRAAWPVDGTRVGSSGPILEYGSCMDFVWACWRGGWAARQRNIMTGK